MCTDEELMLKHRITDTVDASDHPRPYTSATHVTKSRHKEELGLYNKYKWHMQNSVRALTSYFTERIVNWIHRNQNLSSYHR